MALLKNAQQPFSKQSNEERAPSEHTALPTLPKLCHIPFPEPLRVQTNQSLRLTTKGSTTSPCLKEYPSYLRNWHDFPHYNSNTSLALMYCCVPMSPALANSFPHASPSKTLGIQSCSELKRLRDPRNGVQKDLLFSRESVSQGTHNTVARVFISISSTSPAAPPTTRPISSAQGIAAASYP